MVNDKELAAIIARDVFGALDDRGEKCQRIEGKGGKYPKDETTLGGFCEAALADLIQQSLSDNRSY